MGQETETLSPADAIAIESVLFEIQKALIVVQNSSAAEDLPPLETVTLEFETAVKREVGAKFKILILSFGARWEKEKSHRLTMTLTPPSPDTLAAMETMPEPTLADQLVSAILSAAEAAKETREGYPPLDLAFVETEIGFIVTVDGTGNAEFTISPVTFDLGGDLSKKAIHRVRLTFKTGS